MSIDYKALAAPIPKGEIKTRPGKGKSGALAYITSRTVMNRLDRVVGPANWRDEYNETSRGVVCSLYLRIDNEWVGKSDIGVESNIEGDKGSYSDAFKRAAVKWGVGRELYQEGTAYSALDNDAHASTKPHKPEPSKTAPPQPKAPGKSAPNDAIDYGKMLTHAVNDYGYKDTDAVLAVFDARELSDITGSKAEIEAKLKANAPKAAE